MRAFATIFEESPRFLPETWLLNRRGVH